MSVNTIPKAFGSGGSGLNPTADPTNNLQKILSDHASAINTLLAGGGGSGTVNSVVAGTNITVNATDPANPIVSAASQFGSDTLVQIPNETSNEVNALELTTSLVDNTPGSEESQWLIKLLSAGAQVAAYKFGANGMTIPDGSAAHPAIEFSNALGTGLYRQNTNDYRFTAGGTGIFGWGPGGLAMEGFGTSLTWPNGVGISAGGNGFRALVLSGSSLLGGDVVIGPAGANATTSVNGFLGLPTCAGTPTGVPENLPAGKVQAIYDTVAHKIWVYDGGWKSTAALT